MDQFTRRIIGFGVHAGDVDGPSLCRMFNSAIRGTQAPRYLSSDHDPLFEFHRWKANLRILDVTEVKTVPYVPLSHPFVERLIGTIRREFLDQVPFWAARDLERTLLSFKDYYNDQRSHHALGGFTPSAKSGKTPKVANLKNYRWQSQCRGLYDLPVAALALIRHRQVNVLWAGNGPRLPGLRQEVACLSYSPRNRAVLPDAGRGLTACAVAWRAHHRAVTRGGFGRVANSSPVGRRGGSSDAHAKPTTVGFQDIISSPGLPSSQFYLRFLSAPVSA